MITSNNFAFKLIQILRIVFFYSIIYCFSFYLSGNLKDIFIFYACFKYHSWNFHSLKICMYFFFINKKSPFRSAYKIYKCTEKKIHGHFYNYFWWTSNFNVKMLQLNMTTNILHTFAINSLLLLIHKWKMYFDVNIWLNVYCIVIQFGWMLINGWIKILTSKLMTLY